MKQMRSICECIVYYVRDSSIFRISRVCAMKQMHSICECIVYYVRE